MTATAPARSQMCYLRRPNFHFIGLQTASDIERRLLWVHQRLMWPVSLFAYYYYYYFNPR